MDLYSAQSQRRIGNGALLIGGLFWFLGCIIISGAVSFPWHWSPVVFVFHASMFFGEVACYAIVSTAVGIKKTEVMHADVVENVEADNITVNT